MDPLPATNHCSMGPAGAGGGGYGVGMVVMGWGCGSCWDWGWWSGIGFWVLLGLGIVGKNGGRVLYISGVGPMLAQSYHVPCRPGWACGAHQGQEGWVCSPSVSPPCCWVPVECSLPSTDTFPQLCPGLNPWAAEQLGAQQGAAFGVSLFK